MDGHPPTRKRQEILFFFFFWGGVGEQEILLEEKKKKTAGNYKCKIQGCDRTRLAASGIGSAAALWALLARRAIKSDPTGSPATCRLR